MTCATYEAGSVFQIIAELFDTFCDFLPSAAAAAQTGNAMFMRLPASRSRLFLRTEAIDFQFDRVRQFLRNADFEIGARSELPMRIAIRCSCSER